ncbi:EamA family transporter [Saccharopolyspora phatthalungensis]|uniref:Drug/metabolite transporter (DMT)-like permease n=1 Tax=Saccharopolyspora phatthalungensis TaxID=664693 RepID=A0A840Q439_9PSEU|nr:EamA family transporter [Saccharopolyspora phatthalungensis]MBB5154670.1 drug/metabolite transporter (DMT)-like permease [Saccharopolyspora phatthalungensis]
MGELLALSSALCFGMAHFVNGLVSRRFSGIVVAAHAQVGATLVSLLLLAFPIGPATPSAVCWGAISGLGTGIGVTLLYRAMQRGPMSVVVPISDVGAVTLPVVFGIALLDERPTPLALCGIAASVPAIWLVSGGKRASRRAPGGRGVPDALIAGIGFAVQFIGMGQIPADAGWYPVIISRIASVVVIGVLVLRTAGARRLPAKSAATALVGGAVGTVAIILYLLAAGRQMMSIAVVLAALYPAVPVILALLLLGERIDRAQLLGLLCAAVAIGLLSLA